MTSQPLDRRRRSALLARFRRRNLRRALAWLAAMSTCALLAAACGSAPAPGGGTSSGSATPSGSTTGPGQASGASAARVSLSVTFTGSPTVSPAHFELRCEPAGGTVADPAAACQRLLSGASIFAPRPAHLMCPMVVAGAAAANVTGTYFGKKVHLTVVDGGCDLSRWAKLRSVFS